MYFHLDNAQVTEGTNIKIGQDLGGINSTQGHLHLTVSNAGDSSNVLNSKSIQTVLNRTMSPLQAYWQFKNEMYS